MIVNSKLGKNPKQFWEGSEIQFLIFLYFVTTCIIMRLFPIDEHEHRVKHQIHYVSLEKVHKKNYDKQFATVTTKMFKTVTIKNVHTM